MQEFYTEWEVQLPESTTPINLLSPVFRRYRNELKCTVEEWANQYGLMVYTYVLNKATGVFTTVSDSVGSPLITGLELYLLNIKLDGLIQGIDISIECDFDYLKVYTNGIALPSDLEQRVLRAEVEYLRLIRQPKDNQLIIRYREGKWELGDLRVETFLPSNLTSRDPNDGVRLPTWDVQDTNPYDNPKKITIQVNKDIPPEEMKAINKDLQGFVDYIDTRPKPTKHPESSGTDSEIDELFKDGLPDNWEEVFNDYERRKRKEPKFINLPNHKCLQLQHNSVVLSDIYHDIHETLFEGDVIERKVINCKDGLFVVIVHWDGNHNQLECVQVLSEYLEDCGHDPYLYMAVKGGRESVLGNVLRFIESRLEDVEFFVGHCELVIGNKAWNLEYDHPNITPLYLKKVSYGFVSEEVERVLGVVTEGFLKGWLISFNNVDINTEEGDILGRVQRYVSRGKIKTFRKNPQ